MKLKRIDIETAKFANEVGFNLNNVNIAYTEDGKYRLALEKESKWLAPEQALLQMWLREEKKVYLYVIRINKGWEYYIDTIQSEGNYNSYEEALEDGLLDALIRLKTDESK